MCELLGRGEYGANAPAAEYDAQLPRYIRITDVGEDGNLREGGKRSLPREDANRYLLSSGDLLFARSGATVGKTYLHRGDLEACFAGYLIRFKSNPSVILPSYLFAFTKSDRYSDWVKSQMRAGAQPNINAEEYGQLSVPFPPLPEQRRIAAVLDAWDAAALAAERLMALEERKQAALLQYLFTNDAATTGTLADYFIERKAWGRSGLPVYSVTLEGGLTPREQLDRRTESALADDAHALVERGDLVYNMMRMWQGALGVADQPCLVSPAYVVMQPRPSVDVRFAAAWMKSSRGLDRLWAYSHGMTEDRLRLYADDFLAIPVSFPPLDQQRVVGRAHETAAQAVREARALADTLRRQKRGLMQKLLTGEWRVPATGDAFAPGGSATDRLEAAE